MIKAAKNSFMGGLSKDMSALKRTNNSYSDALDIRVVTDHGDTGGAVINVEGNEYVDDIPDVPSIVLCTLNDAQYASTDNYPTTVWSVQVTLTINNITISSSTLNGTGAGIEVRRDAILQLLRTDSAFAPYNLNVINSGNRIRIWSTTHTVSTYSDSGNFLNSSAQNAIPGTSQTIIGWISSRDIFYIWTTNNASLAGGNGTLWSLAYDHDTYATTWNLLYSSDDLLMSTRRAIANPGAIEAAYENSDYLRIAWTDFFNPLRILNAFDPDLMALAPSQFDLNSGGVLPYKPIFQNITVGGALLTGMHQVVARYRTSSGGYSQFSPISNMVTVVDEQEQGQPFRNYRGAQKGTVTGKAMVFEFHNVDTSYEFMEIIHVYRESKYGVPNAAIVAEIPANAADLEYTITGNEDRVELAFDTFLDLPAPFTHAKTIAQKDNILFAGNVYNQTFDIEFDATAIRYNNQGQSNGSHPDQNTYQYQSDGVTVGGEGPNVSYTIDSWLLDADVRPPNDNAYSHRTLWPTGNPQVPVGGDDHYWGGMYGYHGAPWLQGLIRGYKRGETYRFGLVPIRNGQDGKVKWIADIMFPWALSDDNIFQNYRLLENSNGLYQVRTLGIEFTVDISSIQSEIDGFRIVRVERTEADKTMLGAGLLSPLIRRAFDDKPFGWWLSAGFSAGRPSDNWYYRTDPNQGGHTTGFSWHCPDYLFGKPFDFKPGDELVITHNYESYDKTVTDPPFPSGFNSAFNVDRWKLYEEHASNIVSIPLEDATFCARGAQATLDGLPLNNISVDSAGGPGHTGAGNHGSNHFSVGTDSIFLKVPNSGLGQTGTDSDYRQFFKKHYAEYRRPNLAQYGGTSESAKANNVYIDTGTLVRVDALSNSTQTVRTYGGDTFVTIWDTLKMYRNFDADSGEWSRTFGVAVLSPIESDVNLDLRHGDTFNRESAAMDTIGSSSLIPTDFERNGEDFFYNYAYSAENNLKAYLPEAITGDVNEEYSERIYASLPKIKGEIVDSWRDFRIDTMIDLEGNHGPINVLINNNDSLYALQDRAFGRASVNERATVSTSAGDATALGTTGVLARYDYISTHAGSRHQFGIVNSPTSIYFFDIINGELHRFSGGKLTPISSVTGMKAFFHDSTRGSWLFDNDSPIYYNQVNIQQPGVYKGITGTYDYRYDEVLLTFHASDENGDYAPFTIGYDEENNKFTSFYSFQPTVYLNDKFTIFSPAPTGIGTTGLYRHNSGERGVFYGTSPSRARIEVTVQQPAEQSKVFTNMEWNSRVLDSNGNDIPLETVSDITVSTDYQTTSTDTEFKRRFRTWRHKIGRDVANGDRIRDHHAKILLTYQNADNKKLILNDLTTIYDILPL